MGIAFLQNVQKHEERRQEAELLIQRKPARVVEEQLQGRLKEEGRRRVEAAHRREAGRTRAARVRDAPRAFRLTEHSKAFKADVEENVARGIEVLPLHDAHEVQKASLADGKPSAS